MEDILVIQNLSKHYGDQVALDSLSLRLKKGEIYGYSVKTERVKAP